MREDVERIAAERQLTLAKSIDAFNENENSVHLSHMLDSGNASVFSGARGHDEDAIPEDIRIVYTFVPVGWTAFLKASTDSETARQGKESVHNT